MLNYVTLLAILVDYTLDLTPFHQSVACHSVLALESSVLSVYFLPELELSHDGSLFDGKNPKIILW